MIKRITTIRVIKERTRWLRKYLRTQEQDARIKKQQQKKSKEIKANALMTTCFLIVYWSLSLSLCLSRLSQLSRPRINIQTHFWILALSFSHSVLSTNLQITSNSRSMPLTAGCYLIIFDSYSMWHESEKVRRKNQI